MATRRYVCRNCQAVHEFDTRRKRIVCPYCDANLVFNPILGPTVVGNTLYNDLTISCRIWNGSDRLVIPDGVKYIEWKFEGAFQGWDMKEIVFPASLESIPSSCFSQCSSLKKVVIPGNVKKIGPSAFESCYDLEEVIISEGVEEIGAFAFHKCEELKQVTLPSTLKSIGDYAFEGVAFQMVVLPKNVEEIGEKAFPWEQIRFSVRKDSSAERCLIKTGTKYSIRNNDCGMALGTEIINNKLYYLHRTGKNICIPAGVEAIADYAFADCRTIERLCFSDSVKEIGSYAFSDCTELDSVFFGAGLERIREKAFAGLTDTLVELPASIKEIAPNAFGEGCVLSVCGEMPFYAEKQAVLIKVQDAIKAKDALILGLQSRLKTLEEELTAHINSASPEFMSIPQYQTQVFDIERRRAEQKRIFSEKQITLNTQIKQLEADISDLSTQREKCFFLAISKKKELDARTQSKQQELQTLQTELQLLKEEAAAADALFAAELNPVKRKLDELRASQRRWETGKESRMSTIYGIKRDLQRHNDELLKMKNSADKEAHSLEQEHKLWEMSRDVLLLRQKTDALSKEKAAILSRLKLPAYEATPCYTYRQRKAIIEEELLNKAFLEMIEAWNYERKASNHNQFVETHRSEIQRVMEINAMLGCVEDDGISECRLMEIPQRKEKYLPERFTKLNAWFAKTPQWKSFKQSAKEIACARSPKKNLHDKFFVGSDYFVIANGDEILLVFPYCVVKYRANKPLAVLTYDKTRFAVTYTDKTDSGYSTPRGGELINMEFMYLNKDGSPSKRYKDNPLIKTYRFTKGTISDTRDSFSYSFNTHNAALQFEIAFNNYRKVLAEGEYCDIYKVILASPDLEVVEVAIHNHAEAEKKRAEAERVAAKAAAEAEKQRAEAERLAAIAAVEEEKKRIEAERLAAQVAAEEKRRAIIQRQKELNEERKRQADEKRKIYSLFEDDTNATPERETEVVETVAPLEVISKRQISNNVFKTQVKQAVQVLPEETLCYFVTKDGTIISNKKKLADDGLGSEMTIGFVLTSGIDYTQMSACLMRIESKGVVLGEIEFKLNISFYSDF